jgi:hypothetical protein
LTSINAHRFADGFRLTIKRNPFGSTATLGPPSTMAPSGVKVFSPTGSGTGFAFGSERLGAGAGGLEATGLPDRAASKSPRPPYR